MKRIAAIIAIVLLPTVVLAKQPAGRPAGKTVTADVCLANCRTVMRAKPGFVVPENRGYCRRKCNT